jgi:hypothetical protein
LGNIGVAGISEGVGAKVVEVTNMSEEVGVTVVEVREPLSDTHDANIVENNKNGIQKWVDTFICYFSLTFWGA